MAYIKIPFAKDGNKEIIPDTAPGDNSINFTTGYTPPYSEDPLAGGLYIGRTHFNYLMNTAYQTIQDLQRNGISAWSQDVVNASGGYNAGDVCLANYDIFTKKLVETQTEGNPFLAKIPIMSLQNNNTYSPYTNSINGAWFIQDGRSFGEIIMFSTKIESDPSGYVSLASGVPNTYNFSEYPRVAHAMQNLNVNDKLGLLYKYDNASFKIQDVRGYFFRQWSNGSTIDSAREFNNLENDAIRNIKGEIALLDDDAWNPNSATNRTIYESMYNISAWYPTDEAGAFGIKRASTLCAKVNYSSNPAYTTGINAAAAGTPVINTLGNVATFDASKEVPTTPKDTGENRPYNANVCIAIKI